MTLEVVYNAFPNKALNPDKMESLFPRTRFQLFVMRLRIQ